MFATTQAGDVFLAMFMFGSIVLFAVGALVYSCAYRVFTGKWPEWWN